MEDLQFELVGKIGSMALIRREDKDVDYNIISRLGAELRPGMIWVSLLAAVMEKPSNTIQCQRRVAH